MSREASPEGHRLRSGIRYPARNVQEDEQPPLRPVYRAGPHEPEGREADASAAIREGAGEDVGSPDPRSRGGSGRSSRGGTPGLGERLREREEIEKEEERRRSEAPRECGLRSTHDRTAGGYSGVAGGKVNSWETGRSIAASVPKIEVPERFSGMPGEEPSLKNYIMLIDDIRYCWDREGLDPIEFFRGLGKTLRGEAQTHYRVERARLLRECEQGEIPPRKIVDRFYEILKEQFPGDTADRVAEFSEFRRGKGESLLAYYNRLVELSEDLNCLEDRLMVTKFLGGLDEELVNEMRIALYPIRSKATLRQVYQIAKEAEEGRRYVDMMRGARRPPERRRPVWSATEAQRPEEERRERMRDERRCHKCGEVGHLRKDCVMGITCDHCGQMGHFKRNCPRAPTCSECGKKGHQNSQCYRRGGGQMGRTTREQELEQEVKKLRAQLGKAEISEDPEKAMMAWEDDDAEEEEDQESEYALVATLPRDRADLGLRSGGVDGRKELRTEKRSKNPGREPEERGERAKRHPEDRLVCHTTALLAEAGSIAVQGLKVDNAIIDTGAQSVLMGRKLAERLRKQGKLETVTKGMLIMTAEGGPPKWMPSTKEPIEVALLPGQKEETRIRVQCGLSESDDYDLLVGMELIYKIGAQIDAWGEKLSFRTEYWKEGGTQGELPVRFVKMQPRKALQVTEVQQAEMMDRTAGGKKPAEMGGKGTLGQQEAVMLGEGPITLVELFGGIGDGLAAALEAGLVVRKWILVEIDPKARRMAWHHADQLLEKYPGQICKAVIEEAKREGAWDVRQLNEATVWGWGQVDLVVAGWECQGTSRAGKGRGMGDARTALLDELLQVLKWIKEGGSRCCYVVEHVDMAGDPREPIRATQEKVVAELGAGVSWDAALNGARAHRVRRYWQNGVEPEKLRRGLTELRRDTRLLVDDILEPGRTSAPVEKRDHPKQLQCNKIGEPRRAWPTLVSYEGARGFELEGGNPGPGMVYDRERGQWEEPTANERELAMGYILGATAARGVKEQERRAALGRAMDQQALQWLLKEIIQQRQERESNQQQAEECRGRAQASRAYLMQGEKQGKATEKEKGGETDKGKEKEWELSPDLDSKVAAAIRQVLQEHHKTFAYTLQDLGKCTLHELELPLDTEVPVYQRRRRMSPGDEEICRSKCNELLEAGLIRPSHSPYAAATVVAARTDLTGEVLARRMCGDYRELNRVTKADRYSMPTAEEIFDKLEGAVIFSTLDMRQGFNQIRIREGDKCKTAFHGVDGLYEWNVMPFGLRNASAVFQRVMDQALKTVPTAACYIDDVVIFSKSEEEHAKHLKATLDAIADAGLTCHPEKCKIARKTVTYLGFEVQGGRMGIQEAKVAVLDKLGAPKEKGALRALLGFLNYYRRFIPNFSKRAYRLVPGHQ